MKRQLFNIKKQTMSTKKKKKEAFLEKVEEVEKKTQRLNFVPIQIPSPFCSSVSYPIPFKYISLLLNLIRVSF